jgi:tetratricopeptide (TPR) repeat protein
LIGCRKPTDLARSSWKSFLIVFCVVACLAFAAQGPVSAQQTRNSPLAKAGQSAQTHMKMGKEQMETRRFALAVRSFSAAIRRDPDNAEAYLLRGTAYDQMGAPQAAIKDFSRYIELNPKDPIGYLRRADANNFNLDHELAIEDYTTALKLSPSSTSAHLGRGLAYAGLQKYNEAIKEYQRVLRANPRNVEALGNMGVACMMSGRSMEAMQYFEKTLELETDPQWRAKIEKWTERLLEEAKARKTEQPARKKPAGPVKSLW